MQKSMRDLTPARGASALSLRGGAERDGQGSLARSTLHPRLAQARQLMAGAERNSEAERPSVLVFSRRLASLRAPLSLLIKQGYQLYPVESLDQLTTHLPSGEWMAALVDLSELGRMETSIRMLDRLQHLNRRATIVPILPSDIASADLSRLHDKHRHVITRPIRHADVQFILEEIEESFPIA